MRHFSLSRLALASIIFFAVLVRINGLGTWPFSIDEYYFAESINNLLDHGVPRFELGGYYTRGILQQYLSAPLLMVLGDPEFAIRLVPLIASILTIWAVYSLGRIVGGAPVAVIAALLIGLSVWESEFARFARMYTPYQCIFVWYVYFLVRACEPSERIATKALLLLTSVGIFAHETGIILALLNVIPFIYRRRRPPWTTAVAILSLVLLAVIFQLIDFRNLTYYGDLFPADFIRSSTASLPFIVPELLATGLELSPSGLIALLVLIGILVAAIRALWVKKDFDTIERVALSLLITLCAVNQFLFAMIFLFVVFMLRTVGPSPSSSFLRRNASVVAACCALFVFWVAYGLLTDSWLPTDADHAVDNFKQRSILLAKTLLDYPELIERFVKPSLASMPALFAALFFLLSIGSVFVIFSRGNDQTPMRVLYAVVALAVSFVSVLPTQYQSTRYSFFFYPILIVLGCQVINIVIGKFTTREGPRYTAFSIIVMVLFALGEDFNLRHLATIDSADTNFREDKPIRLAKLYYRRWDFSSPADFVNEHIDNEAAILLVEVTPTAYYLLREPDYIYLDRESRRFGERSRESGTVDIWTNATLVSQRDELERIIDELDKDIWMVAYHKAFDGSETGFRERYAENLRFTSVDDAIDVYFFERSGPATQNANTTLSSR